MYRIDILLKQDRKLFHTKDLSLLWDIYNKNTLYTTIKRYVKKGILIPIHKGFYSTTAINKINPYFLVQGYLHNYCYISCESVIFDKGAIFQKGEYQTVISNSSSKFTLGDHKFFVRKLKDSFLYNNYEVVNNNGVFIASLERAVADILYFNPHYQIDNRKIINWKKVKEIKGVVGY